jgi:hypothetical protein
VGAEFFHVPFPDDQRDGHNEVTSHFAEFWECA